MPTPDYGALVSFLEDRFGDRLRWVANFDSETYAYTVQHIRPDLETELTEQQLEVIIHRSIALFNKDHVEDAYFHLGAAKSLVVEHERATAVQLYLTGNTGVVVKLESDAEVTVPEFREACLARLS